MEIDYENETTDDIIAKLEFAIEQHPSFLKVLSQKKLKSRSDLTKNASGNLLLGIIFDQLVFVFFQGLQKTAIYEVIDKAKY